MGENFFEAGKSDLIDKSGETEEKLLENDNRKKGHDEGSEEFRANSKRKSRIQKIIDRDEQKYDKERELKRQAEPVEDWKDSIETVEENPTIKSEEEVEVDKDNGASSDKAVFIKSEIENNREAGQLTKSEDEIENLSILFQEFIDEMEKGGVSNGKIMVMKDEIEKNKRYNIIQNCHILEEKLKELKKDGDIDNKKNSIIIKIDQLRDLNEKVEQVSEFIENNQKAKQSQESETEQQPVTETGQTVEEGGVDSAETSAEAEQTAEEQEGIEPLGTAGTAEEQGIETTEVPESCEELIERLKETNLLANINFANLSSEFQALMAKFGLGENLSTKEIEEVKKVIGAGTKESASALNIDRVLILSSLDALTHKETMQILDKSFGRIKELGSILSSEILKLELQEKQRVLLGTQAAVAVDNFAGAVGNVGRQQNEVHGGEDQGNVVSAGESLGSEIDPNINRDIDRMGSRNSIGKTHKNIIEYLGYSKEIMDGFEFKFKRNILDNMKAKEYGTVRSKCDEQIRAIKENTVLDEKYQRVLIAFYKKIVKIVDENEAKKNQKLLDRLLRRKVKTVSRESKVVEDLGPDRMRTVDGSVVSLEPEPTNDISDEAEEETPQSPQASEIPVINNPDTREISSQIKEKIKGKLKEVKNKNKNQFDAISGFKNSTNLEKTVNENCNQNPIFKSLIVDNLFNSMSQDEKDEIYEMKTRDLLDLYDEVNRE